MMQRRQTDQRRRPASLLFSMLSIANRAGKQMAETAMERVQMVGQSAEMAMADAIISHHVQSSTALLSQDRSERELCAL